MVVENKKQDTQHIAFQRLPAARACIFQVHGSQLRSQASNLTVRTMRLA
jgi:hypothetical protein